MRPAKNSIFSHVSAAALALIASAATDQACAQSADGASPAPAAAAETIDWSALKWDPADLAARPSRGVNRKQNDAAPEANWSRKDNSDGSASLSVKRALPTAWDAKVGVDVGLAPPAGPTLPPDKLLQPPAKDSGSAWANMSVAGASVEARVDPQQEQGKLGTMLSKSLPLGGPLSVTLQNGYAVTQTLNGNIGAAPPGLMAAPVAAPPGNPRAHVFDTDRAARLNIDTTGTSFSAGAKMSSTDEKWLHRVSAEQKLFGGVNITASVSETAMGAADKSLTAGFKKSW